MRSMQRSVPLLIALVVCLAIVGAAAWYVHRTYELAAPRWLWALAALPLLAAWYLWRRHDRHPSATLSTLRVFRQGPTDLIARTRHLPFLLGILGLGGMLIAMARPQSRNSWQDVTHDGIDIVIAMDFSASMLAKDFDPNRLEAARNVALRFIEDRPNDRIGLVIYEGEAFTQCPLTTDHRVLAELFRQARTGLIAGGTAVGSGLATAVNRLRESESKSKVVILLTDGVSNRGTIQPVDAAQIAEQMGIRVYTIGVGSQGQALTPVAIYPNGQYKYEYAPVEIDEKTLEEVARLTGGKYFRATNALRLDAVYKEIDKLERTRVKVTEHSRHQEEYFPLLAVASGVVLLSILLGTTIHRTTP